MGIKGPREPSVEISVADKHDLEMLGAVWSQSVHSLGFPHYPFGLMIDAGASGLHLFPGHGCQDVRHAATLSSKLLGKGQAVAIEL